MDHSRRSSEDKNSLSSSGHYSTFSFISSSQTAGLCEQFRLHSQEYIQSICQQLNPLHWSALLNSPALSNFGPSHPLSAPASIHPLSLTPKPNPLPPCLHSLICCYLHRSAMQITITGSCCVKQWNLHELQKGLRFFKMLQMISRQIDTASIDVLKCYFDFISIQCGLTDS